MSTHGHVYAGSSDGSLRVYDLSTFKVIKAIQALGDEVASIVCYPRPNQHLDDVFLSVGIRVMSFSMGVEKLIQRPTDALIDLEIGENDDDVLNEISLSHNKNYLAFCCDSGTVGVIDLSSKAISKMKTKHSSICGTVKFIPHRPSEILSAGYDQALYHFDFTQRKLLSVYNIPPYVADGGIALSPPFVMSTAMSSSGLFTAGTADGRLVLGFGGEKGSHLPRNKRSKKWDGLKSDWIIEHKATEGPIVAITFTEDTTITISTLLGSITRMEMNRENSVTFDAKWTFNTEDVQKVNSVVTSSDDSRIIIGGITKDGAGIIEIWEKNT